MTFVVISDNRLLANNSRHRLVRYSLPSLSSSSFPTRFPAGYTSHREGHARSVSCPHSGLSFPDRCSPSFMVSFSPSWKNEKKIFDILMIDICQESSEMDLIGWSLYTCHILYENVQIIILFTHQPCQIDAQNPCRFPLLHTFLVPRLKSFHTSERML